MGGFKTFILAMVLTCLGQGAAVAGLAGPVQVIDGDTFIVQGVRVRLHGIDAPETDQTCRTEQGTIWACGAWVTQTVKKRYAGGRAECEPMDIDRYGRTVARCWIGGQDVARQLVVEGMAFAYRKYAMDYDDEDRAAARADRGLHASRMQTPSQFRKTRAVGRIPPDRSCAIKGNISSKGTRIYHSPGQRDYERTGIRIERGERWFCSAAQAEAAGWRAARR